jgi:hypothetical protein
MNVLSLYRSTEEWALGVRGIYVCFGPRAACLMWSTPERVVRDNISATTDSSIDQFISTFNELKSKFDRGIAIQTLNTVHRFGAILDDIQIAGEIGCTCTVSSHNNSCPHPS